MVVDTEELLIEIVSLIEKHVDAKSRKELYEEMYEVLEDYGVEYFADLADEDYVFKTIHEERNSDELVSEDEEE